MFRFTLALAAIVVLASPAPAQSPVLISAMEQEMRRAMTELRLKDEPPPYYIAYSLEDISSTSVRASLDALLNHDTGRVRMLRVEVRVGDYSFDSARFVSSDRESGGVPPWAQGAAATTLDDDPDALKRQLWLMTDTAYKRAVSVFARKKAAFSNRAAADPIPDLSNETPAVTILPVRPPEVAGQGWIDTLRKISAVFVTQPMVQQSEVTLLVRQGSRVFLNSEGFKAVTPIGYASLRVVATTQADDGMQLRDFLAVTGRNVADLPKPDDLIAQTRALAGRLTARRSAKIAEEFTGPVLVEGQAASEIAAQALAPLFLADRAPDSDNTRGPVAAMQQTPPFISRLGSRVLPESFSASDTPSLTTHEDAAVGGAFKVDEEGVLAQDVKLVENGRLLTLLTSRTPQRNLPRSNGHARGGGANIGVFRLTSSRAVPAAELRARYIQMLKNQNRPFGYIVRRIANPIPMQGEGSDLMAMMSGRLGPAVLEVVRVAQDGAEEPVRGLTFAPIPHTAFRDIVEASLEAPAYTFVAMVRPGSFVTGVPPSGQPPIATVIAPNFLFEEVELQKTREVSQKPPIVPPPSSF